MKLTLITISLLFCLFVEPTYSNQAHAIINVYNVEHGDSGVTPIAVWISCNGVPIALITTSSYGLLAGDVKQLAEADYLDANKDEGQLLYGAMNEVLSHNTLANIDIGEREWIECRVK